MKIDRYAFDRKGRYYGFYLCIMRWTFMIAVDIADWDLEFHIGKMNSALEKEITS